MEEARQTLCRIYEAAFGSKPQAHIVLAEREQQVREVKQLEHLKHEALQITVQLKARLKERDRLQRENKPRAEIAACSQDIRNYFVTLSRTIDELEQRRDSFQGMQDTLYYDEMKKFCDQMTAMQERLKLWELDYENKKQQEFNPLFKLSGQGLREERVGAKQQLVRDTVEQNKTLDDIFQPLESYEELLERVNEKDRALEDKAAEMIVLTRLIKEQERRHKEILDQQDEALEDINKGIHQARDEIKEMNKTAKDIQKRLMRGSTCIIIAIVVAICVIGAWWIYKLST